MSSGRRRAERKAADRVVQLHRRDAEVEQHAVHRLDAEPVEHGGQVVEIALDELDAGQRRGEGGGGRIRVERDEPRPRPAGRRSRRSARPRRRSRPPRSRPAARRAPRAPRRGGRGRAREGLPRSLGRPSKEAQPARESGGLIIVAHVVVVACRRPDLDAAQRPDRQRLALDPGIGAVAGRNQQPALAVARGPPRSCEKIRRTTRRNVRSLTSADSSRSQKASHALRGYKARQGSGAAIVSTKPAPSRSR